MSTIAPAAQVVNPISDAVLATERAIIAAEGRHHVNGRYIADASLADRARRAEAERRVRDAERRAAWLMEHDCRWCGGQVAPGQSFELVAGEPVHAGACLRQLDALLSGVEVAA